MTRSIESPHSPLISLRLLQFILVLKGIIILPPPPCPLQYDISSFVFFLLTHLLCAIFNSCTLALISSHTSEDADMHYFHQVQ